MINLIGLTGKIGSGKSTCAKILNKLGYIELSFAETLKDVGLLLGFTHDELFIDKNKINNIWGISGRDFLQKFGTDVMKYNLPTIIPSMSNIWINLVKHKINLSHKYVISDVRFEDEYNFIKELKGVIIKINSDNIEEYTHISEKGNIKYDYIIYNDKVSFETLEDDIKLLLNSII